jgi:hypothetical protein
MPFFGDTFLGGFFLKKKKKKKNLGIIWTNEPQKKCTSWVIGVQVFVTGAFFIFFFFVKFDINGNIRC